VLTCVLILQSSDVENVKIPGLGMSGKPQKSPLVLVDWGILLRTLNEPNIRLSFDRSSLAIKFVRFVRYWLQFSFFLQ